ncbi:MAG: HlyD family efflux transporter periplasmic adaptor subunit [Vicinamibacterales bacterium]|nr:HlyD family efflux transporter periplasmic adaptor subunit [Vicinamibacterales bacterium]
MRRTTPLLLILLATACDAPPPGNQLRVSGHVEATEVRLAADAGGRILELPLKEGDRVEPGALVVRLDARDATLALERAQAERAVAEAQLRLVQAPARAEDLAQARAQIETAQADVAAARAELEAAEADLDRFESLLASRSGTRKQRDDAATRRDVARQRVAAAESRVRAAEQARARIEAGARHEEVDAARARVASAAAQIATLEKLVADATLLSPTSGIVTARLAEPGEVVAPRMPLLVITDLDRAWADLFVPEPAVPRITLGQTATIYTDAGGAGIEGRVEWISPTAEFTPRNVQTADERSKLVYRIRVRVDNRDGVLKSGMPVEAVLALADVPQP